MGLGKLGRSRRVPYLLSGGKDVRRNIVVVSNLNSLFFTFNTMSEQEFPEIQGGGSLILAWQIRNKRVLVVGGGEVRRQWISIAL